LFHSVLKGRSATKTTFTLLPVFLTFYNQKLKGYEDKHMCDLASIEMPDLPTCNALEKIEYTSAKLECQTLLGKPGSRRHGNTSMLPATSE